MAAKRFKDSVVLCDEPFKPNRKLMREIADKARPLGEPLPPDVLANALQDRTHPASGRLIKATPVRKPFRSQDPAVDATNRAGDAKRAALVMARRLVRELIDSLQGEGLDAESIAFALEGGAQAVKNDVEEAKRKARGRR